MSPILSAYPPLPADAGSGNSRFGSPPEAADPAVVMIVDDEPVNLALLGDILAPHYAVRACKSSDRILATAAMEPRPDLILLDVMMPGMNGYQALIRLRELPETRDIPIIFVTTLSQESDEEYGLSLGAADYITKPVKPSIVLARARTQIENKRAREALRSREQWLAAEVEIRTRELQIFQELSLNVMLEIAETRDAETGNHILRTQYYIESLARAIQRRRPDWEHLDERRIWNIAKAAPLHDIGKVGIPDSILRKPGALSPEERRVMEGHTTIGYEAIGRAIRTAMTRLGEFRDSALESSLAVLQESREIALSHHERWDGSGYPQRLAGTAIPASARLMAVADVFDALSTARVYKSAWTLGETVDYLRQHRASQFDPDLIDALDDVIEDFERIRLRFAD